MSRFLRPVPRGVTAAVLLAAGLVLAACGGQAPDTGQEDNTAADEVPDYEPSPVTVAEQAPAAEVGELRLPYQLDDRPLLDPTWDAAPKSADEIFLAPGDTGGILTFTAADAEGDILWQAERPRACSGFTITDDGERPLAVLTDIDPEEGSFGSPTATAYDLHTGEEVWGPVEVPGPHQGPGTVFAAPPEEQLGEVGPRMLLDPATGEILADESADDSVQVVGEYRGVVLLADDTHLHAYHHGAETADWSLPLQDYGWEADTLHSWDTAGPEGGDAALVGGESDDRVLIDLETGDPIAEDVRDAAYEATSGTWIALGDELTGYDDAGEQLFSNSEAQSLQLEGTGGVMVYLRTAEGQLQVHNAVTGDIAEAYDPDGEGSLTVPFHITETGGGIVRSQQSLLLVPIDEPATAS
ncbi:MAG: hypothetical protein ACTHWO_05140 [Nesterenkonia sp.]